MARVEIQDAKPADAKEIDLRDADLRELEAVSSDPPWLSMERSIRTSLMAWTTRIDGEIAVIYGAGPIGGGLITGEGCAWMLASPFLETRPVTFYRHSRVYIRRMHSAYDTLVNLVDERNEASLRWLEWLGAEFEAPKPYGRFGLPFVPFTLNNGIPLKLHCNSIVPWQKTQGA